jgi:hypothetical protein
MAQRAMKNITIILIRSDWKCPTERFLVLNPPVATMLKAWLRASKHGMPAIQSERKHASVRKQYTTVIIQIIFADL